MMEQIYMHTQSWSRQVYLLQVFHLFIWFLRYLQADYHDGEQSIRELWYAIP